MTAWLAGILLCLLLGNAAGSPRTLAEPTASFALAARAESITFHGGTARVIVAVSLEGGADLAGARLRGWVPGRGGFDAVFGIPDRSVRLRRGQARIERYALDLEAGRLHHLFFALRRADRGGESPVPADLTTAYLRVNLDPRLEPEAVGDLLQFRATMTGRPAP